MLIMILLVVYMSVITYNWVLQFISSNLKSTTLNANKLLKPDFKIQGIYGQAVYHYIMSKYIEYRGYDEMMTPLW